MQRNIILTADGSTTIQLPELNEQYHSVHGALSESMHVYIQAGLQYIPSKDKVHVLEIGFGTGLNALLTFVHRGGRRIEYHGIELYPVSREEVNCLNYAGQIATDDKMQAKLRKTFETMHQCPGNITVNLEENFVFLKVIDDAIKVPLPEYFYDVVYFDAFAPDVQPALWSEDIFGKIAKSMRKGGVLVTYCAKGVVKRAMKNAGFEVEGLPGPQGKREITRAIKK